MLRKSLQNHPNFFNLSEKDAEIFLLESEPGAYLFRPGEEDNAVIISIRAPICVYHLVHQLSKENYLFEISPVLEQIRRQSFEQLYLNSSISMTVLEIAKNEESIVDFSAQDKLVYNLLKQMLSKELTNLPPKLFGVPREYLQAYTEAF